MSWYPFVGCLLGAVAGHSGPGPCAIFLMSGHELGLDAPTDRGHAGASPGWSCRYGGRLGRWANPSGAPGDHAGCTYRGDRRDGTISRARPAIRRAQCAAGGRAFAFLIGMPVVGRWAMVVGAFRVTYARSEGGLAQPFLAHLSWRHLCVATVTAGLVLALLLGPWPALCCLPSARLSSVFPRPGSTACSAVSRVITRGDERNFRDSLYCDRSRGALPMTGGELAVACLLDAAIGDPRWLPHPVRWMGALVDWYDRLCLSTPPVSCKTTDGGIAVGCCVAGGILCGWGLAYLVW